jgi:hypothetical protein
MVEGEMSPRLVDIDARPARLALFLQHRDSIKPSEPPQVHELKIYDAHIINLIGGGNQPQSPSII